MDDWWVSVEVGDERYELVYVLDLYDVVESSSEWREGVKWKHLIDADGSQLDLRWNGDEVTIGERPFDLREGRVFYVGGRPGDHHAVQFDIPLRSFRSDSVWRFLQHTWEDEARRLGRHPEGPGRGRRDVGGERESVLSGGRGRASALEHGHTGPILSIPGASLAPCCRNPLFKRGLHQQQA